MNKSRFLLISLYTVLGVLTACNKGSDEPKQTNSITCLPPNVSAHLIAFYPFSNGSLNDLSGNEIHLINNTTAKPAPDRNGNPSCAFEFNNYPVNVDSLIVTNTQKLNDLSEFSVSLWYQPLDTLVQAFPGKEEYMLRYDKWNIMLYDCRKAVFGLIATNTTGYAVWDNDIIAVGAPEMCQKQQKLRTGNWHHLVATFNAAKKIAKIYRDNVLQEANGSAPWTNRSTSITSLLIGSGFTGRMDDIAIFNKELDTSEISSLYSIEPCCTELQ